MRWLLLIPLLPTLVFAQGTWQQMPNFPTGGRWQACAFEINGKGYAGMGAAPYHSDFWEYNPVSNTWSQRASFPGVQRGFPFCFATAGKGYFGGGSDGWNNLIDLWQYDPGLNSWTQRSNVPVMNSNEAFGFGINGKGYIGGGGAGNTCWEYDPGTDLWTQKASCPGQNPGAVDRGAFVVNNIGYHVNGFNELWGYDPAANNWIQRASFPGTARFGAVGFSIDCIGYFGTGFEQNGSNSLNDFWAWSEPVNNWTQITSIPSAPRGDGSSFIIGTDAYVIFGSGLNEIWKFVSGPCNSLFIGTQVTASACTTGTGTATATPLNGQAPYSYLWVPTGQTTATATGLLPGTYTVTVTDANSLTGTMICVVPTPYPINLVFSASASACGGSTGAVSVSANGGPGPYTYLWSNGATSQNLSGLSQGTYSVQVTDQNGCSATGWVTIGALPPPPPLTISGDTILCPGESTFLSAFFNGFQVYQWLWNTGQQSTGISVSPTATTTFSVSVTSGNCVSTASATVYVLPQPAVQITGDTVYCEGETVNLNAAGGSFYLWSNGSTTPSISFPAVGNISLSVIGYSSGNCRDTAYVNITVVPVPQASVSASATTITPGQSTTLYASGNGTYNWSNGVTTDSIVISSAGTYCVTVTNAQGCTSSACVTVTVDLSCTPFIPSAFSPNGQGQNEFFRILGECFTELNVMVFDRWGEKVFESNDPDFRWDGTFKGKLLNSGVFVYVVKGTLRDGTAFMEKGNLTLVR